MWEIIVTWFVRAVGAYFFLGLVFAVPFLWRGVGAIDPDARAGTRGFKLLILPGVAVFWPWLARRWFSGANEPSAQCDAHRRAAAKEPA